MANIGSNSASWTDTSNDSHSLTHQVPPSLRSTAAPIWGSLGCQVMLVSHDVVPISPFRMKPMLMRLYARQSLGKWQGFSILNPQFMFHSNHNVCICATWMVGHRSNHLLQSGMGVHLRPVPNSMCFGWGQSSPPIWSHNNRSHLLETGYGQSSHEIAWHFGIQCCQQSKR